MSAMIVDILVGLVDVTRTGMVLDSIMDLHCQQGGHITTRHAGPEISLSDCIGSTVESASLQLEFD